MIEAGEWVRCDAALSLPGRPAVQMAAEGDVRNLRRCEQLYAFLTHRRQQDWATARSRGWATIADPRYPGAVRNVCPRHALTPPTVLVLIPLRPANRVQAEDAALALLDAIAVGQELTARLARGERSEELSRQQLAYAERLATLVGQDPITALGTLEDEGAARAQRYEQLRAQEQQP